LTPSDPDRWLGQIAATAAEIHACSIAAPPFESWLSRRELEPPESSSRPELWRAAFAAAGGGKGVSTDAVFIHRDFQHFNFLWSRERLSGVVDWTMASTGPPGIDVGHCRLNLAVLFSAEWAEEFRLAYEAEAGQAVDPYWDLHALLSYSDRWQHFIPIQVDGRAPVDTAGMTARVEAAVAGALARLGA
jgi:aminoglycoside phosphotransferase (APT) family kinase protein